MELDTDTAKKWLWQRVFVPALHPFEDWIGRRWIRAALVAWIALIAIASWSVDGTFRRTSFVPWVIGLVGCGVIVIVARRRSRTRPAIMIARFWHNDAVTTSDIAALEDQVSAEVQRRLASAFGFAEMEHGHHRVDVGSLEERTRAMDEAADLGCCVVVAASVRIADGELTIRPAILPVPRRSRRFAIDNSGLEQSLATDVAPVVAQAFKRARTGEIASLAQIAASVVMLQLRKAADAQRLLAAVEPATYLSLFYAACAATRSGDWAGAESLTSRAVELEKRPAALWMRSHSLVQLGRTGEAESVIASIGDADTLPDVRAIDPSDDLLLRTSTSTTFSVLSTRLSEFSADLDDYAERSEAAHEQLKAIAGEWDALNRRESLARMAREKAGAGNAADARDLLLAALDAVETDATLALLLAEQFAALGDVEATRAWANRAETMLPGDINPGHLGWQLVKAHVAISDIPAAARCLERVLPFLEDTDLFLLRHALASAGAAAEPVIQILDSADAEQSAAKEPPNDLGY